MDVSTLRSTVCCSDGRLPPQQPHLGASGLFDTQQSEHFQTPIDLVCEITVLLVSVFAGSFFFSGNTGFVLVSVVGLVCLPNENVGGVLFCTAFSGLSKSKVDARVATVFASGDARSGVENWKDSLHGWFDFFLGVGIEPNEIWGKFFLSICRTALGSSTVSGISKAFSPRLSLVSRDFSLVCDLAKPDSILGRSLQTKQHCLSLRTNTLFNNTLLASIKVLSYSDLTYSNRC